LRAAGEKSRTVATANTYGLKSNVLSQWETLAQSLSSIAPTASPAAVIPLVIAVSGASSWIVYVLATCGCLLVALHVNVFTSDSASPGSLYVFVHDELSSWAGLITGWALLVAYIGTAAAVLGGVVQYTQGFAGSFWTRPAAASVLIAIVVGIAVAFAYKNVELSTRFMLWIEATSIALILLLFLYPTRSAALAFDKSQFSAAAFHLAPIRAGLILATFSFVGFESAAALGAEAKNPLRTIPKAIMGTTILSGAFFVFCAYAEVSAFSGRIDILTNSSAPLQLLAHLKGAPWIAPLLTAGALVSFFACTLACITAAARTTMMLSANGSLPAQLSRAHGKNQTPHVAVIAGGIATLAPAAALLLGRVSAFDLYGWLATIATFGFVTAYILVVAAAVVRMWRRKRLSLLSGSVGLVTIAFLIWAFIGSVNWDAAGAERWLAPIYFAVILAGVAYGAILGKRFSSEAETEFEENP
jgi:amino acid transporter